MEAIERIGEKKIKKIERKQYKKGSVLVEENGSIWQRIVE